MSAVSTAAAGPQPTAGPPAPVRRAERQSADPFIRLIFRGLAVSFAVVGLIFLLFPDATVRVVNAAGGVFGVFTPAPASELRFWLSLGVSYMALVTILAAMIQRDPVRYRHLMPILAAGKFCSSFTCLLFFALSSATFLYLLNFLVDGSITLIVLGCYAWTGLARPGDADSRLILRSQPILGAVVETLLPSGGPFEAGGKETAVADDLWRYAAQFHQRGALGLAILLHVLEYGPYLFGPRRQRFTRLSPGERARYLGGFERSRLAARRQIIEGLKLIAMLHFYDYAEVQRAVGFDGGYLRDKLLAGPNAAHHRARLA